MNNLFQAVENENIADIKNYLKAYITGDPADADNSIKTALKKIEMKSLNVWEQHDGTTFNMSRNNWTQDYFVDLQVDLRMNFSKERYMHMLEVGKVAFPTPVEQPKSKTQTTKANNSSYNQTANGTESKKDQTLLYMGIAGVAVVVLAVVLVKLIKNG